MRTCQLSKSGLLLLLCGLVVVGAAPRFAWGEPSAAANSAFNAYVSAVEFRLAQEHRSTNSLLSATDASAQIEPRLRRGELVFERLAPADESIPGAMLHHWRGTAFAAGGKAEDFVRLIRDFNVYPQRFSPQVVKARVLAQEGDHVRASMRIRQKHVITVVMDTTYDVYFVRLDARHGYSASRSTQISEIDSPGTPAERALPPSEEHGFLWRLNTYWSYEERDGGLYLQIESVSLTRSIPHGLAWAVRPFVEKVPRESLEFTLRSVCNALQNDSSRHL